MLQVKNHNIQKLIITSTSVYGTAKYTPIDETPFQGQSPYSVVNWC